MKPARKRAYQKWRESRVELVSKILDYYGLAPAYSLYVSGSTSGVC